MDPSEVAAHINAMHERSFAGSLGLVVHLVTLAVLHRGRLSDTLPTSGVTVRELAAKDMIHGFLLMSGISPAARALTASIVGPASGALPTSAALTTSAAASEEAAPRSVGRGD